MKERSRLIEATKRLNVTARVTELDNQSKVTALRESVKLKDLQLSRKDTELERVKNQLSRMSQDQTSEINYKQKLDSSQRLLQLSKEECSQLSKKIEELRNQLSAAQMNAKAQNAPNAEFAALQVKYERIYRQAEEFKKANRQLIEHLGESRREPASPSRNSDELKNRLDAAMKIAMVSKREVEVMRNKIASLVQQETAYKAEINQLQAKLKKSGLT
jgi:hypothetical protein